VSGIAGGAVRGAREAAGSSVLRRLGQSCGQVWGHASSAGVVPVTIAPYGA
jgi:hypothetical protein